MMVAALVESRLPGRTLALMGPTEIGFDDAARLVAKVMGRQRRFVHAPIAFHYLLARVAQATMTVPLIATAQVRILEEELVEPTLAPDAMPEDLAPAAPFDEESIRAGLPGPGGFALSDLRVFANRRHNGEGGVVVCGEGTTVIKRDPKDVLEFVFDVDRYRRADLKIGRVHWMRRDGNTGLVRHGGRLRSSRAGSDAVISSSRLTPDWTSGARRCSGRCEDSTASSPAKRAPRGRSWLIGNASCSDRSSGRVSGSSSGAGYPVTLRRRYCG